MLYIFTHRRYYANPFLYIIQTFLPNYFIFPLNKQMPQLLQTAFFFPLQSLYTLFTLPQQNDQQECLITVKRQCPQADPEVFLELMLAEAIDIFIQWQVRQQRHVNTKCEQKDQLDSLMWHRRKESRGWSQGTRENKNRETRASDRKSQEEN